MYVKYKFRFLSLSIIYSCVMKIIQQQKEYDIQEIFLTLNSKIIKKYSFEPLLHKKKIA